MLFDIKTRRFELMDGKLYIEFSPCNQEIENLMFNGGTYDLIDNSVESTIEFYKNSVREEMYNLLPEEIKSNYINAQFKITNCIDDPSKIDYDILCLHKKRTIVKGELKLTEYYKNYTPSSNTYSDLAVTEFRDYTRDSLGIVEYRNQTSNWLLNNETTGLTINSIKYYSPEEAIQEGIDRRNNMISFAKTTLLSELKAIVGEPTNQMYSFDLLTSLTSQMNYFSQGYTQPLRDAISASTKGYLTSEIKEAIINQLIL